MTSKVIVPLPAVAGAFQLNKKRGDVVSTDRCVSLAAGPGGSGSQTSAGTLGLTATDPVVRANQLEQNVRFLQEQHAAMLVGLHSEIETLRQKNRDLHFQLVFPKGSVAVIPSNTPDEERSHRTVVLSSSQGNVTPIQIEILERDIAELRTNLSESRTRNVYLQNIVDEQKKRLATLENEKIDLAAVGKKIGKENKEERPRILEENGEDSREKLEDADRLIRRLRRENEEQRKEIVSLRSSISKGFSDRSKEARDTRGDAREYCGGTHRSYYRSSQNQQQQQQNQQSRFPPLHPHNFWNGSKANLEYQGPSHRRLDRVNKESEVVGRAAPMLPHLRDRNTASTSGYSNPAYNHYPGPGQAPGQGPKRNHYYRKQDDGRRRGNKEPRNYHRDQLVEEDKHS